MIFWTKKNKKISCMKKTVLMKSSINRALSMLRRLKRKNHEDQIHYLTVHLIRKNRDKKELEILRDIQRKKSDLLVLQDTIAYKNAKWFWSDQKMQTFISYKKDLESYRKMASHLYERDLDDPEIEVILPQDLAVIMNWFQLISLE